MEIWSKYLFAHTLSISNIKSIIALLQTSNYTDYSPLSFPFTEAKYTKNIFNEFISNDGVSLFRDTSPLEECSKVKSSINLLLKSLRYTDAAYGKKRHIVAIITDNPSNLCIDESDAMYLSFDESECILDEHYIKELQRISGEFDFSLIQEIINNQESFTNKIYSLIADNKPTATDENFEKINTIHILQATMAFLKSYGIISDADIDDIQKWFNSCENNAADNLTSIVNDFYNFLNINIQKDRIRLANQFSEPFYTESQNMAFESNGYLNFGDDVFKKIILPSMKSTKKSGLVLSSLFDSEIFPPAKGNKKSNTIRENKRTLVIEKANGIRCRVSVYSVTTELLNFQSKSMLDAVRNYDFFYPYAQIPESEFSPIVSSIDSKLTAGVKITPDSNENFHMYVTGASGNGKSYFLMQQALFRAQTDDKVIIFDNGGYFRPERLKKIFCDKTNDIIEEYISFHYIPEDKIPVDLFSLENCEGEGASLRHSQAMRLYNVLTAASSYLGEKQTTALTNTLKDLVPSIESSELADVSDEYFIQKICELISEMLQSTEMIKNGIDERLSSIVSHIKGRGMLRQTWGDFLDKQKKIVVITTERERNKLGGNLIDLMLASLSAYKSYTASPRYTVIIDEISFLNLSSTGTINSFAREGRHKNISLLLASQDFMNDKLNNMFGNFGTMVFFKPTAEKEVASYIDSSNIESDILRNLKTGECVVKGYMHSKSQNENVLTTISGRTANFIGSPFCPSEHIEDASYEDTEPLETAEETAPPPSINDNIVSTNYDEDILQISVIPQQSIVNSAEQNIPPQPPKTRVIVLAEETTVCDAKCDKGLSLYIEFNDKKILFDAGSGRTFAENAKYMLIDFTKIDFAVLSHAHRNNSGGFQEFFLYNQEAPVYAREEIKGDYYSKHRETTYYPFGPVHKDIHNIGINNSIFDKLTLVNKSQKLYDNIFLVGHSTPHLDELGEKQSLFKGNHSEYEEEPHDLVPDNFMHEQCLVLDSPNGLIIVSGCSHGGAVNTILEVIRFCKDKPVYAYIGGFHLWNHEYFYKDRLNNEEEKAENKEIDLFVRYIESENIIKIYLTHCAEERVFKKLKDKLGDRIERLKAGDIFSL